MAMVDEAVAINAPLIGVNNRDLKSFKVDLATTERLAAKIEDRKWKMAKSSAPASILNSPSSILLVAESGIHSAADVARVAKCGAGAILVGESLVKQGDIPAKVRELLT